MIFKKGETSVSRKGSERKVQARNKKKWSWSEGRRPWLHSFKGKRRETQTAINHHKIVSDGVLKKKREEKGWLSWENKKNNKKKEVRSQRYT